MSHNVSFISFLCIHILYTYFIIYRGKKKIRKIYTKLFLIYSQNDLVLVLTALYFAQFDIPSIVWHTFRRSRPSRVDPKVERLILNRIVISPVSSIVPSNPSVSARRRGGVLIVREAEGDCSSYQNRHRQPDRHRGQSHCHPWLHPPAIKWVLSRYSTSGELFTAFWLTSLALR